MKTVGSGTTYTTLFASSFSEKAIIFAQITRTRGTTNNVVVDDDNSVVARIAPTPEDDFVSTLSGSPVDLWALWEEYEFGVGGRKAAKKFTFHERGKNKYKYHRRKVVWDKIASLIRSGHSYHTAILEIYRVYGRDSTVTEIINKMRVDRGRGGHPGL